MPQRLPVGTRLAHAVSTIDYTANSFGAMEATMERSTIQDWTTSKVPMKSGSDREVRYRVYRDGDRHFQEIREADGTPIHTLELPEAMKLERGSYEVLLRYVLVDVFAA